MEDWSKVSRIGMEIHGNWEEGWTLKAESLGLEGLDMVLETKGLTRSRSVSNAKMPQVHEVEP